MAKPPVVHTCEEVPVIATSGSGSTGSLSEDHRPCSLPLFLKWSSMKHLHLLDISWPTLPETYLYLYIWRHKSIFPKTIVHLSSLWMSDFCQPGDFPLMWMGSSVLTMQPWPLNYFFSWGGIPIFWFQLPWNAFACVWNQWKGVGGR